MGPLQIKKLRSHSLWNSDKYSMNLIKRKKGHIKPIGAQSDFELFIGEKSNQIKFYCNFMHLALEKGQLGCFRCSRCFAFFRRNLEWKTFLNANLPHILGAFPSRIAGGHWWVCLMKIWFANCEFCLIVLMKFELNNFKCVHEIGDNIV